MFKLLLQNFIKTKGRSPNAIEMLQLKFKAASQANRGQILPFKQKRDFPAEIKSMIDDGTIKVGEVTKKNDKVIDREMFKNSNLNKPTVEGQMEKINKASNRINEIKKEQADMYKPKTDAELIAKYDKQNKEAAERLRNKMKKDKPEDKADGGRIGFRVGKFVLDKVIAKFLGNPKKVKQAADDIFPTGDYKYDAQMAAEALVENNPRIFKNRLYDDLDMDTQIEIYGAVLGPIQKNMSIARQLKKASRPEKTLAAMKKGEGIDMSNPDIADEFTRFMKETDPKGSKTIEQTVELANFDPKGRKKNATGGRAGYYTGGITDVKPNLSDIGHGSDSLMSRTRLVSPGSQATTSTGLNYLLAEDNDNIRVPFSTGKLAGGIDSAIEKNKNLEERIARNKRMTDFLNKMYDERAIKNAPEGVLMDPPPEKNDILSLGEEGTEWGSTRDPRTLKRPSDIQSNTIIFDDGTIYYKDTGEYYREDGSQVPGPSKDAKIKPFEMEAAEGGRIGFAGGGDPRRRAFLKFLASIGGATAAAKSGLLSLGGKGTAKKAVPEIVKQATGSGTPPPYFFKLVEKIKLLGDDTLATKDKAIATKYKDYTMEEDFAGNIEIIKKNNNISEDVYMSYKVDEVPTKIGKKKSTKVEEYEEFTATPDGDGKMKNIEQGVPDEVVNEGSVFDDDYVKFSTKEIEKADGGRIGFSAGGGKFLLSKLGINSTTTRFLEKVFGKQKFQNLIKNDPEMHRGLLEVAEMFRNKDKEGLKMYMQKFLPHMDDATVEDFIVGSGGTEGIEGQLIRLGSGRDYAGKIEMMKKADNMRKLDALDIDKMKPNAEGGRIGFSGGGIFRAIIAKAAAAKGLKPYEFIKVTSYKSLPQEVKMFLSADDFAKLKSGQQDMYTNYIDMAKTRKNFQDHIEGGKNTPARELFEGMEKTMDQQSYVPKNVTVDDIAEMELMVKNRFNKGRKDNAQGGLQTMLGE